MPTRIVALVVCCLTAGSAACAHTLERSLVAPEHASTLDSRSPFLKVHLRSGGVYVLDRWRVDSGGRAITGSGHLFDASRRELAAGDFRIPSDSAALFETNVVHASGANTALTVMSGITAAVAGYCLANPKSCFGSCPAFYIADSTGSQVLVAEGFSASVAPALEATDVDAMWEAHPRSRDFDVVMTNEAFETHVVRHVDVLAIPRPPGSRVIAVTNDSFVAARDFRAPAACRSSEGDCRAVLSALDHHMRSSTADSNDLATKETIDLDFIPPPGGEIGLVIASRQSLMSTYLFYQGLAYLGSTAGHWLAMLSSGSAPVGMTRSVGSLLGHIEVMIQDERGLWKIAGSVGETGPLATDVRLVPLARAPGDEPVHVRLRATRGLWRIDWVALAAISSAATPIRLVPRSVEFDGHGSPDALRRLRDGIEPLVTTHGDRYRLRFRLPGEPSGFELLLDARGYYLEWMRREWLAEENAGAAARYFLDPAGTLRSLAAAYKRQEPGMDSLFWGSRYVRH